MGFQDRLDVSSTSIKWWRVTTCLVMRGRITGTGQQASYEVTVHPGAFGASLDASGCDVGHARVWAHRDAAVHGFGEQFAGFNLSGRLLPIVVREQGVGRGQQPLTLLADLTRHGAGGNDPINVGVGHRFVTDDLRGRYDPADPSSYAFRDRGRHAQQETGRARALVASDDC